MRLRPLLLLVLSFFACARSPDPSSGKGPEPASRGLTPDGALQISPSDRCPVCGMSIAEKPDTAAGLTLQDQRTYYFCGNGCFLKSWLHPEHYLNASREQLERPIVQAFFEGKPLDARQAVFVAGSDVMGRMGPALVALPDSKESLEAFQARHGGKATFHLEELTDERWEALTGKKAIPQAAPAP